MKVEHTEWESWFAWYPVAMTQGVAFDFVWLKRVKRRKTTVTQLGYRTAEWEYRRG